MATRTSIDAFLSNPAIALFGLSRSGRKFGNLAYRELVSKGYRVYPIHPTADAIGGVTCYKRLADVPEPPGAALIVVPPVQALQIVQQVAEAGIQHVWLQQGAQSPEVLDTCRRLGLNAVAGECVLMFARPSGYHKLHRWVWQLLGKLPQASEEAIRAQ